MLSFGSVYLVQIRIRPGKQIHRFITTTSPFRPFHPVTDPLSQRHARYFSRPATAPENTYQAVVVGAGPAGVAVVGNLLEQKRSPILWVDELFQGGRLNRYYREVPSNTKVKKFVGYAEGVSPFRDIAAETQKPNAYTVLKDLDQEKPCHIAEAADLCIMLTEGLNESRDVFKQAGKVSIATLTKSDTWIINVTSSSSSSSSAGASTSQSQTITSPLLVLCTGASPTTSPLPALPHQPSQLPLDPCLKPSLLRTLLPRPSSTTSSSSSSTSSPPLTIAVIGASHSAILVLRNLYNLSVSTHPHLRVKWFTRHPLRYAEERDGWIYRDNTGLKGAVADWAKENLEDGMLEGGGEVGRVIRKVATSKEKSAEEEVYRRELDGCDYVVQAVGYKGDETVELRREEGAGRGRGQGQGPAEKLVLQYDHEKGGFRDERGRKLAGLYGAGIAWPERVVDPEGNVEFAVGLFKFMSYLKRVVPGWT